MNEPNFTIPSQDKSTDELTNKRENQRKLTQTLLPQTTSTNELNDQQMNLNQMK